MNKQLLLILLTLSLILLAVGCGVETTGTNTATLTSSEANSENTSSIHEHLFSNWWVSVEPTCEVQGKVTRRCSVCGVQEERSTYTIGHHVVNGQCVNCGKTISAYSSSQAPAASLPTSSPPSDSDTVSVSFSSRNTASMAPWNYDPGSQEATSSASSSRTVSGGSTVDDAAEKAAAKQREIDEETKRHEQKISEINAAYDTRISINDGAVQRMMNQCGVSYLSSVQYYTNRISQIESELSNKYAQYAYASASSLAGIQREINSLTDELTKCNTLKNAAEMKQTSTDLQNEKQRELDVENMQHSANMASINYKYR